MFKFRPWALEKKNVDEYSKEERVKLFHNSKISASLKDWDVILAKELICKAHNYFSKKKLAFDSNNLDNLLLFESSVDSHFLFEGHLPPKIPFSFVERIIINDSTYIELKQEEELFKIFNNYVCELGEKGINIVSKKKDPIQEIRKGRLGTYAEPSPKRGLCFSINSNRRGVSTYLPINPKDCKKFKLSFEMLGADVLLRFTNKKEEGSSENSFCLIFGFQNCFNFSQGEFLFILFYTIILKLKCFIIKII